MTTLQMMFEIAARECSCAAMQFGARDRHEGSDACDPCLADRALKALAEQYRDLGRLTRNDRLRVACEISADYIEARDSEDLSIPDCEDDDVG